MQRVFAGNDAAYRARLTPNPDGFLFLDLTRVVHNPFLPHQGYERREAQRADIDEELSSFELGFQEVLPFVRDLISGKLIAVVCDGANRSNKGSPISRQVKKHRRFDRNSSCSLFSTP
jgi:hypothetical protein